jgi:hypothetical protein
MKNTTRLNLLPPRLAPTEDEIRDYAYHLYEQGGRIPGHDVENWLEARACLQANIPTPGSRARLHRHLHGQGPAEQEELCAFSPEARNIAT